MKSWLHNIAESYMYDTLATRKDLKEHYNVLTEEEKFTLLSQNTLKYLDEQLKTVYGFSINDLTEEELGSVLMELWSEGRYRHPTEMILRNPRDKSIEIVDPQTGEKRTDTLTNIWHRRNRRLQTLQDLSKKKKKSAIDTLKSEHPDASTTPSNDGDSPYTQTTGGPSYTGGRLFNIALRDPEWLKGERASMRAAGTHNQYVSDNLARDMERVSDAFQVGKRRKRARRDQSST